MMGKTHVMSGAAFALSSAAFGFGPVQAATTPFAVVALYTAVLAGGSLWPDWDSKPSTVVRSFGIFGTMAHEFINAISVLVFSITRSRRDSHREGGHRTLFHTILFALFTGATISTLASLPQQVTILNKDFTLGQIFALLTMWAFLHVGIAGLFEKTIKKARGLLSVYGVMFASLAGTFLISYLMPEKQTYWWLGLAATIGMIMHLLGDMITKQGIPMFWPIPIIGKRWYEVTLPSFLRIKAGGDFENMVLMPIFTLIAFGSAAYCIWPLIT